VDGSGLARTFFAFAALLGAAMCSAFSAEYARAMWHFFLNVAVATRWTSGEALSRRSRALRALSARSSNKPACGQAAAPFFGGNCSAHAQQM